MILETQNIIHQREKSNQTVAVENNITFLLLRAGTMRLFLYPVGDQIFCSFDIFEENMQVAGDGRRKLSSKCSLPVLVFWQH